MVKKQKVLMALSGGVDSAVSAYLLKKQGYEVEAAFMKNWSETAGLKYSDCPWLDDRRWALRVAAFLQIPLHTLDFEKQYAKTVMDYFFKEYKAGRTPNPDVMCNKEIKFKLLYDWAMKNGFDYLATGHYAQIGKREKGKGKSKDGNDFLLSPFTFYLARSADEFKDQTYFIYNIKTEQLPHVLFPIGHMKKAAVKQMAKKIGAPNADRKESMGLCFVGKIRLKDFLEQKLKAKPGKIILLSPPPHEESSRLSQASPGQSSSGLGEVIVGEHQGLHYYTIGQRQGIRVDKGGPYFVVKKDLAKNILYVTNDPDDKALETKEIEIHSVNWIAELGKRKKEKGKSETKYKLTGRFRHQGDLIPLTITEEKKGIYKVVFSKPQKAIASGQSLVLYKGKECVGGGVIV